MHKLIEKSYAQGFGFPPITVFVKELKCSTATIYNCLSIMRVNSSEFNMTEYIDSGAISTEMQSLFPSSCINEVDDDLNILLSHLPNLHREIIELRWGITTGHTETYTTIAEKLNLSRYKVTCIFNKAMAFLRELAHTLELKC